MAAPRKSGPSNDKPEIHLNLDSLENERAKRPFTVTLGGRVLEFRDPTEMDWQDALLIETDVRQFFIAALSPEDAEFFLGRRVELYKLNALREGYQQHYELDPGNSPASQA